MDRPGHDALAGAGLAGQEHGGVGRGDRQHEIQNLHKSRTLSDDRAYPLTPLDFIDQILVLLSKLLAQSLDWLVRPHLFDRERDLRRDVLQKSNILGIRIPRLDTPDFKVPKQVPRTSSGRLIIRPDLP